MTETLWGEFPDATYVEETDLFVAQRGEDGIVVAGALLAHRNSLGRYRLNGPLAWPTQATGAGFGAFVTSGSGTLENPDNEVIRFGYNLSETLYVPSEPTEPQVWLGMESDYADPVSGDPTSEIYFRFAGIGHETGSDDPDVGYADAFFASFDRGTDRIRFTQFRGEQILFGETDPAEPLFLQLTPDVATFYMAYVSLAGDLAVTGNISCGGNYIATGSIQSQGGSVSASHATTPAFALFRDGTAVYKAIGLAGQVTHQADAHYFSNQANSAVFAALSGTVFVPGAHNSSDLGLDATRWKTVFCVDVNASGFVRANGGSLITSHATSPILSFVRGGAETARLQSTGSLITTLSDCHYFRNLTGALLYLQISSTSASPGADNSLNLGSPSFRWATVFTNTVNASGQYQVGGTKVVGARETGWAAATGTASKAAIATYAAPTISNPPTQAEIQAIADALQAWSRRGKAIGDALAAHGLIGA